MQTSPLQKWWNGLSTIDQLALTQSWNRNPVPVLAIQILRRSGLHIPGGRWELREAHGALYWHPQLQRFIGERAGFVDQMRGRPGPS